MPNKNNPPVWPSVIAWPILLILSPLIMLVQRIRKGYWA